uniref:SSD domain-containing protein n=1 Tax=Romanomermis culicivorax TaxID=13658 RepID=A0A915KRX7_ROMCU
MRVGKMVQIIIVKKYPVRLDNTFLMISAVRHTSRTLSVEERIAEGMCEAAVSITVTVLTDVLSFATGLAANIPAVIIFSLYTTVAVIFSFIYQLTFSMGLLVLALRMEERGGHSLALIFNRKVSNGWYGRKA